MFKLAKQTLLAKGMGDEEQAAAKHLIECFGQQTRCVRRRLTRFIDERCWDTKADLAEAYVNWGGLRL